ncbi:MAG: acetate uptake transporter [Saprospiraceae bacterium]|nr:acetate uptake transporter [Saprospiraceae bacterium]MCB9318284.1 acetate uptake transporter [Lewinellaceae bacterium]
MDAKLSNPAPLGLMGFGMTTVLLNIHNAGFFPVSAMILSMGIFYGGIAQVIAGILEFQKGNTFGTTAFTSYGLFWITLVALWVFPEFGWAKGEATGAAFMGWYLFLWGVFTFFMWIGTFNKNKVLQFIFLSLWILFLLLAIRDWSGSAIIGTIAGWEGMVCGASAIYLAMAEVINETREKQILPVG